MSTGKLIGEWKEIELFGKTFLCGIIEKPNGEKVPVCEGESTLKWLESVGFIDDFFPDELKAKIQAIVEEAEVRIDE